MTETTAPILHQKYVEEESTFLPQNLLREARRQKQLPDLSVPAVCVLDPDGDLLAYLQMQNWAVRHPGWACYHTHLYTCQVGETEFGLIGQAVGASFAVLLAEQLFVSGCQLLLSITSAGQISGEQPPPYFVLIDKAVRDEGTSYHYLPPSPYSHLQTALLDMLTGAYRDAPISVIVGSSWTTDAPYRETATAIDYYRTQQVLAVEMEAAALYAFAQARRQAVVCFAHVTNQMGTTHNDFEKGEHEGALDALALLQVTIQRLRPEYPHNQTNVWG
ncbi:nucleoside phosphorylase [Spirosoma utsteinense]|uniref:Uridine phosphorylase n=1 Tax=Spirosoma utsteinense TaxID=2585773 RepID=A0ABR6WEI5_9BACT|nr:nucleoside phosphorylase [Spirosoma utsteinense]MBC3789256.1 uridine phosphorylase [Spirosoma utsteinense]MBC3794958.1 uridine phosphorylase [Spirosoma utsteinense]